jgi:hypothetical protein
MFAGKSLMVSSLKNKKMNDKMKMGLENKDYQNSH